MVNALNLSLIEGRLTKDPQLFWTKNGYPVCRFDLAVNFSQKNDSKIYKEVSFITVNTWNKVAEVCSQYLKKGSMVRIKGRIKQDSWTGSDGKKRNRVYIEANSVDFLANPKKQKEQE